MREFYQCDIDILGSDSLFCEVELIVVTMKALENLGLKNLKIKINSRKLLKELLLSFGYLETEIEEVCIIFDKIDKIGKEKVEEVLFEKINNEVANKNFIKFLNNKDNFNFDTFDGKKDVDFVCEKVKQINSNIDIEFDSSLVRGQSYYTGCVFEIYSLDFSSAVGGGGRYDGLVQKFTSNIVPAVGLSIGFERIFGLLERTNIKFEDKPKIAIFFESQNFCEKFILMQSMQSSFNCSLFENPKKLGNFLSKLEDLNYCGFVGINSNEIKYFEKQKH